MLLRIYIYSITYSLTGENMKYLKCLGYIFIPVILLGMIVTLLYYFDIIGGNLFKYLTMGIFICSLFLGNTFLGKNSKEKGWLEGLKIGLGIALFFFIFNFLAFDNGIDIKSIIYYLIIILTSMFGAMFGIRNVVTEK